MLVRIFPVFRLYWLAVLLAFIPINTAQAEVAVTFYSHDFGKSFPHAFFAVKGKLGNGKTVNTSYGFTAVNISPVILWGSVKGHVQSPKPKYITKSNAHFTVIVTDSEYRGLMALVARWRNRKQKSYSLNRRNCVHFASEAIALLGYKYNPKTKNWKKPKSFLQEVMRLNKGLKK